MIIEDLSLEDISLEKELSNDDINLNISNRSITLV